MGRPLVFCVWRLEGRQNKRAKRRPEQHSFIPKYQTMGIYKVYWDIFGEIVEMADRICLLGALKQQHCSWTRKNGVGPGVGPKEVKT